jgi:2-haloacid dehalogenase
MNGSAPRAGAIRALFFDVFGTLVDWRTSVARECAATLAPLGHDLDWLAFATAWRDRYQPAMEQVRSGAREYVKLDVLHRENLVAILPDFGVAGLSEEAVDELSLRAWRRLDAWPDVVEGLRRLRERVLIAPCSNGNISLMAGLARHNGIAWDAVLGAEVARDYKTNARVYDAACAAFDLEPGECAMVAAHTRDLLAAQARGLRTIHIARPNENGPGKGEAAPSAPVDIAARDLLQLCDILPT